MRRFQTFRRSLAISTYMAGSFFIVLVNHSAAQVRFKSPVPVPDATYLDVSGDSDKPIYCSAEGACTVDLQVPRPGSGSFCFRAADLSNPGLTGNAALRFDAGSYGSSTVRVDPLADGCSPMYELQAGAYEIEVQLDVSARERLTSIAGTAAGNVSLKGWKEASLAELPLSGRNSVPLVLNHLSARAEYKIHVNKRSRVFLGVSLPPAFHKGDSYFFTAWTLGSGNQRLEPEDETEVPTGELFYFVLPEGIATLTVQFRYVQNPLPPEFPRDPLVLTVEHISPIALPDSLGPLQSWLKALRLDTAISVWDIACKTPTATGIPLKVQTSLPELFGPLYGSGQKQPAVDCELFLHTSLDKGQLRSLEEQFRKRTGTELWERAFREVSLAIGISTRKLEAIIPVWCAGSVVREIKPGLIIRDGSECQSASFRQPIQALNQGASPGVSHLVNAVKLGTSSTPFLHRFLGASAVIDFPDKQDDFVEIIVRNLRGTVIRGGNYWEKLEISLVLQTRKDGTQELITFVDGFIASGIGRYPADSQFTTSMEPTYYQALSEYARTLTASMKQYLESQSK